MIPALSLDASDDTDSAPLYGRTPEALELERKGAQSLSALSYDELTAYRKGCFDQFCKSTTATSRDHWLHAMADAIVESGARP